MDSEQLYVFGGFASNSKRFLLAELYDLGTEDTTIMLMKRHVEMDSPSLGSQRYSLPARQIALVSFINEYSSDFVLLDTACV